MPHYKIFDKPVDLTIHTKRPAKWILIDTETGEVYRGSSSGYWEKMKEKDNKNVIS